MNQANGYLTMGLTRHCKFLFNLVATIVCVVQCHKKGHDNANPAAAVLTKDKARELTANPSALIHEALNLVRTRRSVDLAYDDPLSGTNQGRRRHLVRKQPLEETLTGEEREHTIDKRQIPDGLGMLTDYSDADSETSSSRIQEMTGFSRKEKVHKRATTEQHENDVITLTKKSQDTRPLEFNSMALEELIKKLAPLLRGKDGRDGKDGKDGRDGRDGQRGDPGYPGPPGPTGQSGLKGCSGSSKTQDDLLLPESEEKPSGHLTSDGGAFRYRDGLEFSRWCSSCPTAHLAGGMKSTNTSLQIPKDGRYFVYCQVHLLQTEADRTGFEILVNGKIFLSKVVKGEEATYSGAVFSMKKSSIVSVRLLGPGTIDGDHTVNFLGAYQV